MAKRKTKSKSVSKNASTRLRKINRKYADGDIVLSRCPDCGSTDRTKYFRREEHELPSGWEVNGIPCTHVVYRYTQCVCGKYRRDRQFEHRV